MYSPRGSPNDWGSKPCYLDSHDHHEWSEPWSVSCLDLWKHNDTHNYQAVHDTSSRIVTCLPNPYCKYLIYLSFIDLLPLPPRKRLLADVRQGIQTANSSVSLPIQGDIYLRVHQAIDRCPWMSNDFPNASLLCSSCVGKAKSTSQMRQGLGDKSQRRLKLLNCTNLQTSRPRQTRRC